MSRKYAGIGRSLGFHPLMKEVGHLVQMILIEQESGMTIVWKLELKLHLGEGIQAPKHDGLI